MNRFQKGWREFWFPQASPHELGFYRFLFFFYAAFSKVWHIDWTLLKQFEVGSWSPINPLFSVPPRVDFLLEPYFTWVLWIAILFSAIGFLTRFSIGLTTLLSGYYFLLWGSYQNSGHITQIMWLGFLIFALSPCGHGFSIDSLINKRKRKFPRDERYGWVRPMLLLLICLEYFAAGVQKWMHSGFDWFLTNNLALTLNARCMRFDFTPNFVCSLTPHEGFLSVIAFLVFAIEVTSPLALFSKKLRPWILVGLFGFQFLNATLLKIHGQSANFPILLMFFPWKNLCGTPQDKWKNLHSLKPGELKEYQGA